MVRAWCSEAVVITTAHFPWDVRCAFPRQSMQEHAWSPHGSHSTAGSVINSSWGPGVDSQRKWLGLRSKVRLGRKHPQSSLAVLRNHRALASPWGAQATSYEGGYLKQGRAWNRTCYLLCFCRYDMKEDETLQSQEVGTWDRTGQAGDRSPKFTTQLGNSFASGKPEHHEDSQCRGRIHTEAE